MKKLLIPILCLVSVAVTGCANFPWVYKIDIQQGNVISQDQLNKVKPGMTKKQVQFLMGTPLVQDPFHRDRWDYVYTMRPGGEKRTEKKVTMYFEHDKLASIEGDMRPQPGAKPSRPKSETVTVHPTTKENKGFFHRLFSFFGFG